MKCLILSVLWLSVFVTTTGLAAPIDDVRLKGLSWLIKSQNGDGSFRGAPGLEVTATAAAVEALVNAGITKGDTYASGVAWLQSYQAYSTDSLSRQIIALSKAGRDTTGLVSQLISWRNDTTLSWGAYDHYSGSFPDTSLAMDALKTTGAYATYAGTGNGIGFMVSSTQQNTDGGWPYYRGDIGTPPSKVIPTAQTLLTLNHYKTIYGVQSFITNGITWLKAQQKIPGGGFGEGTTGTVLETALAYRALLTELGSADTAVVNAQAFLVAQQQSNGSWGSNDPLLTNLVLAAVPSIVLPDTNNDGIPDALQTAALLGANPSNAPIGRAFAKGNGQSVSGATTATALPQATLNQPYTTTLAGTSGWTVASGRLPDGLSLNASTGQISGTPIAVGAFNFVFQATATGSVVSVDSQIQVVANSSTQVPALPGWAMLLMALMLILIIRRAGKHAIPVNS